MIENQLVGLISNPIFLLVISLWSLLWKVWALWLAARANQKVWFVAMLAINTVGILEIIYIFLIAKWRPGKPILPDIKSR